jgi:LPS export ABC transporter protein LptC
MKKYAVLTFIFLLLTACSKDNVKMPAAKTVKNVVSIKGFNLTQTENGKIRMSIIADTAEISPSQKVMRFYGVKAKYFDKGEEVSNLKSKQGLINNETNDMEVNGDVVLETKVKAKLETQQLKWISRSNKMYADGRVRITRGDNIITGIGMESDLLLENVVIKKPETTISDIDELQQEKKENK